MSCSDVYWDDIYSLFWPMLGRPGHIFPSARFGSSSQAHSVSEVENFSDVPTETIPLVVT